MRAKRCNPATRSPPDSNGEKNHRRPQETGAAKPKEICESILTLRAEFPAHSAITCPVRGLKKSLRYARLCREARRNPAGAPTRGQQHLQMPFRNPDFQRCRPFPQTFPRGQTETADSPAPIRRKPAIKHKNRQNRREISARLQNPARAFSSAILRFKIGAELFP